MIKTKVGRAFIAIRDADIAAETMGVNLMYYKTLAFAVSAFYTGLAAASMLLFSDSSNPSSSASHVDPVPGYVVVEA